MNHRSAFRPLRHWAPGYWRHLVAKFYWRPLLSGPPVGFRTADFEDPALEGNPEIYRFSYRPNDFGDRICVTVAPGPVTQIKLKRLYAITSALWDLTRLQPSLVYHDLHIDSSDCGDGSLPAYVVRSAKRPGEPHPLIPNLYLLANRRRTPAAKPWPRKSSVAWFRGASTGHREFEENKRVQLCLLARQMDGLDCKLTAMPGVSAEFTTRCKETGILAPPTKQSVMNDHRYLIDVDGNTTSWDRYLLTGLSGGVPIRFEPEWIEYWHEHLRDGENVVTVDRTNLVESLTDLRRNDYRGRFIAEHAHTLVKNLFSRQSLLRAIAARIAPTA
jgi:hypothetical protein